MTPRETRLNFEGLYRSHRNEVYRAALRKLGDHHEAEDVTQTAFLDAYRAMLRGSHPDLPRAWLLAIAENVRRRRFRTTLGRPREEPLREPLPSADPPWRAQTQEIRAALSTLAENQRKAFLLRELGGFSYGEIAAELNTSVPAVQMLLFRARQKLRAELDRPGTIRLGGLIPIPHWLVGIADRVPAGAATPRVAGLVAAGVIAAGVGVTSSGSIAEPDRRPPAAVPDEGVVVRALAPGARPSQKRAVLPAAKAAPVRGVPVARTTRTPAADARTADAEPVAPIAPPATTGGDDRAPAPTLIPASPPVSQAPTVPVVTVPLPPELSERPEEKIAPALPDIPIVQPPVVQPPVVQPPVVQPPVVQPPVVQPPVLQPPPPALPGGAEVATREVTSLLAGP